MNNYTNIQERLPQFLAETDKVIQSGNNFLGGNIAKVIQNHAYTLRDIPEERFFQEMDDVEKRRVGSNLFGWCLDDIFETSELGDTHTVDSHYYNAIIDMAKTFEDGYPLSGEIDDHFMHCVGSLTGMAKFLIMYKTLNVDINTDLGDTPTEGRE